MPSSPGSRPTLRVSLACSPTALRSTVAKEILKIDGQRYLDAGCH